MSDPRTFTFDERDGAILAGRVAQLDALEGPRVGDWVRFPDHVWRRISYIWTDETGAPQSVQTSDSGSYYLGNGYVSMSGSLFTGIGAHTLTDTGETKDGDVWFFHHDTWGAHRGVHASMAFRVFATTIPASVTR